MSVWRVYVCFKIGGYLLAENNSRSKYAGDVQRNEGKEAWGMGLNFKFPWQKKKEKEDSERAENAKR